MAASVSLLTLTSGAATACSRTAETLDELAAIVGISRSIFSFMAAECFCTKDVMERLEFFVRPGAQRDGVADYHNRAELRSCFEVLVRPIIATLSEVDVELQRLRRYSAEQDSLVHTKLVPILQDSLYDARSTLRKNRSSISIIMDCLKSGILADAQIQVQHLLPSSSTEKMAFVSQQLKPQVAISLTKQLSRSHIQQQMANVKPRPSRTFRLESKVAKRLHEGINKGDYSMVCKALSEKGDPNLPSKNSKLAPIHCALNQVEAALRCEDEIASRDLILIVMALVLTGASMHAVNEDRCTPLIRAVKGEMGDGLVALMLEYGAAVNAMDREQNTALHYAAMKQVSAEMGNMETIRTLLAFGADLDTRNQRGRTPLYEAVMWQHLEQATQLLDYGSDLEIADNNGWTPLYSAVLQGHAPLTRLLCKRGAFVDKKDKTSQTPLHYAVSQGRQEIVEMLVDTGADVNLISKGETPLCQATAKSNGALIAYLLSHGADVSVPSPGYNGALPIHIAAIGKDLSIMASLIEAGSFIDAQDGPGRTPLAWATEAGRNEIIHYLMSKGASPEA
ncbi:hypothetical protein TruAng_003447 [Truncatella angustata]|nr:hypothetical protein TruAng_003447 [Truncatella angustata]